MGRKPAEMHANAILSKAIYAGLVALVRLARLRVNKKTRKFYASIERMWTEARYALDLSLGLTALNPITLSSLRTAKDDCSQNGSVRSNQYLKAISCCSLV
jgi:hypothetical protein